MNDGPRQAARLRGRILGLLRHGGPALVTALAAVNAALGVAPVVFVVATSVMIGHVPEAITGGDGSAAWTALLRAFGVAAAAFVGQQVLAQAQTALAEVLARRIDGEVSDQVMGAALRSDGLEPLEDEVLLDHLGEAVREIEQAAMTPGRAAAGLLALVARYLQLAGFVLIIGTAGSWPLAAGVLAVTVLFRHGQRSGMRRFSQVFVAVAARWRRVTYLRRLAVHAPAAKEIRVFGLAGWLTARYREAYLAWIAPVWARRIEVNLWPYLWFTGLGLPLTALLFAWFGRHQAAATGDALTAVALVAQAAVAAMLLGTFYPESDVQTQFGMNAYHSLEEFERAVPGPAMTAETGGPAPVPREAIRLAGVAFAYPGSDRLVLDGLDLTVPVGRFTALVGLNGAGKTTLIKLLARLYEPSRGTILIDDRELATIPAAAWRRRLGVVFQDFLRYEVSLADNIAFGALEHREDRAGIRRAAVAAGLLDLLGRLPAGLDTPLAAHLPGGVDLSGGQWQRVAIARVLFALDHGASLVILDEPTAAQDIRAEARFIAETMRLVGGVTTILISHRLAAVRHADAIAVLDGGRIVEHGTHDDLLRHGGRYAELFRLQAARFGAAELTP